MKVELQAARTAVETLYEQMNDEMEEARERASQLRRNKEADTESDDFESLRDSQDTLRSTLKVAEDTILAAWEKCEGFDQEIDAITQWSNFTAGLEMQNVKIKLMFETIATVLTRTEERAVRRAKFGESGQSATATTRFVATESVLERSRRSEGGTSTIRMSGMQATSAVNRPFDQEFGLLRGNSPSLTPLQEPEFDQNPPPLTQERYREEINTVTAPYRMGSAPPIVPTLAKGKFETKIETFDGRYETWDLFWSSFCKYVDSQPYDDVVKLNLLMNHLAGEALEFLKGAAGNGMNYQACIKMLCRHYDKERMKINAFMRNFDSIRPASMDSASLMNVYFKANNAIMGLARYENVDNAVVRRNLKEKFPKALAMKLERKERESGTKWDVRRLLDEILDEIELQKDEEAFEFTDRTTPSQPQNDNYRGPRRNVSDFKKCTLCNLNNHLAKECRKVTSQSEVHRIASEKNLCRKCLESGHRSRDCNSPGCEKCRGFHHTKLCRDPVGGNQPVAPSFRNSGPRPTQNENRGGRFSGNNQGSNWNRSGDPPGNPNRQNSQNNRDNGQNFNSNRPNYRNNRNFGNNSESGNRNQQNEQSRTNYGQNPFRQ